MLTKMQPEISSHDGNPSNDGKLSCSSSSSSFDPFFDFDDNENDVVDTSIPKYEQDTPISPISVVKSGAEWSMISDTPEWSFIDASPNQSPLIQTMGRPGADYDPNRIPSSIFASKPASPMDWSVASNESLFSIGMGNNSFEYGELTPVIEVPDENDGRSDSMKATTVDPSKQSVARTERVDFLLHGSKLSDAGEIPPADGVHTCASTSRISCESRNSNKSFAFPVFTREGGKSGSVRIAPDILLSKPPERSQSQPQTDAVCPKPAATRWFSCFSCCPHCC